MPYLGIFDWNSKKPLSYLKSTPSNLSDFKVWCKLKILFMGLKMPNLRIFGLEFENTIVMFQISVREFVLLQSFVQK